MTLKLGETKNHRFSLSVSKSVNKIQVSKVSVKFINDENHI